MAKFRAKRIRILVATNIMSRGIDVKDINLVINYDLPHDARIMCTGSGRTARVNAKGEAITLVTQKEMHKLKKIEQLIGAEFQSFNRRGKLVRCRNGRGPGPRPNRKTKFHQRKKISHKEDFPPE